MLCEQLLHSTIEGKAENFLFSTLISFCIKSIYNKLLERKDPQLSHAMNFSG